MEVVESVEQNTTSIIARHHVATLRAEVHAAHLAQWCLVRGPVGEYGVRGQVQQPQLVVDLWRGEGHELQGLGTCRC